MPLHPPPSSTLFPYTTLFRSISRGTAFRAAAPVPRPCHYQPRRPFHCRSPRPVWRREVVRLDRKSTRLNSSHRTISYAVLCLKKKNVRGLNDLLRLQPPNSDR